MLTPSQRQTLNSIRANSELITMILESDYMKAQLASQGYTTSQITDFLNQPQIFIELLTNEHSPFAEVFITNLEAGFKVGILLGIQSAIQQQQHSAPQFYEGPSLAGAMGFTLLYRTDSKLRANTEKGFASLEQITADKAKNADPADIMPLLEDRLGNFSR